MSKKSKVKFVLGARSPKRGAFHGAVADEEAVKVWLRNYSAELASVGVDLGLTPMQKNALENRLLVIYQSSGAKSATQATFKSRTIIDPKDPMKIRWFDEHVCLQDGSR